jgi:pyruvate dehydrogenase E1 component
VGGTAGRTTLNGEGLQHQDGHSPVLAHTHPRVVTYDPAYAYEMAVIIREGMRRMYAEGEELIYYLTAYNESYPMPAMPEGVEEGILRGLYRLRPAGDGDASRRVRLMGAGPILNEVVRAASLLEESHGVPAEVWSVTGPGELLRDAEDVERWNRLHPDREPRRPFLARALDSDGEAPAATVYASDYMKALPRALASWVPGPLAVLGTDGLGRSESREALRDFFEVDHRHVTLAALSALVREGRLPASDAADARRKLEIDPDKPDPTRA